jgi:hypothetical protein
MWKNGEPVTDQDVLTAAELNRQMRDKSDQIDDALDAFRKTANEWVEASRQLKMARSKAFASGVPGRNAEERDAAVYALTEEQDYEEERLKMMRDVCKEALRAREDQLSGLQSLAGALREELKLARVDNYGGP